MYSSPEFESGCSVGILRCRLRRGGGCGREGIGDDGDCRSGNVTKETVERSKERHGFSF